MGQQNKTDFSIGTIHKNLSFTRHFGLGVRSARHDNRAIHWRNQNTVFSPYITSYDPCSKAA